MMSIYVLLTSDPFYKDSGGQGLFITELHLELIQIDS